MSVAPDLPWIADALAEFDRARAQAALSAISFVDSAMPSGIAETIEWQFAALPGTGGGGFGTRVFRVTLFYADEHGDDDCVTAVLKVIRRSSTDIVAPSHLRNPDREARFYQAMSGLTPRLELPSGLRIPVVIDQWDGSHATCLLLEDVGCRPIVGNDEYAFVARQLARLNAQPLVTEPWMSRGAIAQEYESLVASAGREPLGDQRQAHPAFEAFFDSSRLDFLARIEDASPSLLALLETAPSGLCHVDAFSRNGNMAGDCFALFDWASAGIGPLGSDPATLFWLSLAYLDAEADDAGELESAIFHAYVDGLDASGADHSVGQLRTVFRATVLLRYRAMMCNVAPLLATGDTTISSIIGRDLDEILDSWNRSADFLHTYLDDPSLAL